MAERDDATKTSGTSTQTPAKGWGASLQKFDRAWSTLEARLCVVAIVLEVSLLGFWVMLKGLSTFTSPGGTAGGLIMRSVITSVALGMIVHYALRPKKGRPKTVHHRVGVAVAIVLGLFVARAWVNGGVQYASNLQAWIQNASVIALFGGLRGIVTRLTLWLALLGASLAVSRGKHINIDIGMRLLPKRAVAPLAILGALVAAMVCFAGVVGFVDSIGVTRFGAQAQKLCDDGTSICDTPVGGRIDTMKTGLKADLFLLGRQSALDLRTFPKVIKGDAYDKWLTNTEWNAWITERKADWVEHYTEDGLTRVTVPEELGADFKQPIVAAPNVVDRAVLVRDTNFIVPFGLFIIGLKFLVRIALIVSGVLKVDPDSVHGDEDMKKEDALSAPEAAEKGGV